MLGDLVSESCGLAVGLPVCQRRTSLRAHSVIRVKMVPERQL